MNSSCDLEWLSIDARTDYTQDCRVQTSSDHLRQYLAREGKLGRETTLSSAFKVQS